MRSIHSEDYISTVMSQAGKKCRPVRETHQPSAIASFVVDTPIPSISSSSTVELRRLLVEFLDRLNSELERRFDVKDMTIWTAMDALNTSANYNESAPYLIQIFKVAVTAGYTQTCVECLFSALNRIDTPHRRNQLSTRQTNLTWLHFEQKVTRGIAFNDFAKEWRKKPRKLIV